MRRLLENERPLHSLRAHWKVTTNHDISVFRDVVDKAANEKQKREARSQGVTRVEGLLVGEGLSSGQG